MTEQPFKSGNPPVPIHNDNDNEKEEKKKFITTTFEKLENEEETNFVNIIVGEMKCKPLIKIFEESGILIRPGYEWGILKQCIRISIGDEKSMKKVFSILKRWVNDKRN